MDDDKLKNVTARIGRLITALSCASFNRLDHEAAFILPQEEDELGMLEGTLQLFIDELTIIRVNMERAIQESESARAELEARLRIIEEQRHTISELSTPIIDLWDQVLTLPIIGAIDTQRAADITSRLLTQVSENRASFVLLDLTGVLVLDLDTAKHLARLAQAVKLLGAQCVITGIRPEVAQTLCSLDLDWSGTPTLRSLREGLRYITQRTSHVVHNKVRNGK